MKPEIAMVHDTHIYDPLTGDFHRKKDGKMVGWVSGNGYQYVWIKGRVVLAHRLAWFMQNGAWPAEEVDHINGIRTDNRICNLRLLSKSGNMQNLHSAKRSNKTSGLLGVTWNKQLGKWVTGICVGGKNKHIGCFADKYEAHAAYIEAKRRLHPGCTI